MKDLTDLDAVKTAIDEIVMATSIPVMLAGVAAWLREADLSAAGETGRQQADVIDALANWEW